MRVSAVWSHKSQTAIAPDVIRERLALADPVDDIEDVV